MGQTVFGHCGNHDGRIFPSYHVGIRWNHQRRRYGRETLFGTITEQDEFAYYSLGTEFDVYVGTNGGGLFVKYYESLEVSGLYIENGISKER